ncbi:zinc finger RING-type protein [Fadolivirus algeromassiliense]|jgi:hypothetical protein|uniref:Zinc finger RING-type protein n=1 Tax=Fadolivirus FV1/VV64 TaxID=3070911 RepID=A0A7D3QWF6_9VIRU|nr:zinc finger RING-type protein [Fadolivirus algeromassiliense]QKF94526.1 zinc finger RING-type protein [Fadolivirus FV1/VV64]
MENSEVFKSLTEKEKLFIWLYFPYDILDINNTIDEIINLSKKHGIPNNIVLKKIIEYYHIKNFNKEQIIDKLYQYKLINVDTLHKVIEIIDTILEQQLNSINDIKLNTLIMMANKYNGQISHDGYPIPDKYKGRPHLEWCECYYDGCHKIFPTEEKLKEHLTKLGKHTWGFHYHHEQAIANCHLTPQKIINNNITTCPSVVCDKATYPFTPEELCNHFKLLGLHPFWKPGDIIIQQKRFIDDDSFKKIYMSEECIICNSDNIKPSVMFLPCNHCVVCIDCYGEFNKCPICRKDITAILPT